MCFSASASFTAGAGLLAIGAATISQSKTTPQKVLACMPLIFSVQQLGEGFLWLSMMHAEYAQWRNLSMHLFLVFAQVVWPVFVPLTILLFEKDPVRKKILQFLSALGILTGIYFAYCQIAYNPEAKIEGHHIRYILDFPFANKWYSGITYLLAGAVSPFISSIKPLRILGYILLGSYIISNLLYRDYLVSVWCYFAAVLSISVLVIIVKENRSP